MFDQSQVRQPQLSGTLSLTLSEMGAVQNSGKRKIRGYSPSNSPKIEEVFHRSAIFAYSRRQPNRLRRTPSTARVCCIFAYLLKKGFPQVCVVLHSVTAWPQSALPFSLDCHG